MEINTNTSNNQVTQQKWKMTPTWSQNRDQNPSNKHEKTIQKTSRKMMQK
jgi:hypothetical protein